MAAERETDIGIEEEMRRKGTGDHGIDKEEEG